MILRAAQRQPGGGPDEIDSAIMKVRQAFEYMATTADGAWPGGKDKKQRSKDERWTWIRAALEVQASGAVHTDSVTKSFTYTREVAEVLIAMAGAMLRLVP